MIFLSLFIIGHMGLFFYTLKGSIISVAGVPTTDIIEPIFQDDNRPFTDNTGSNLEKIVKIGYNEL